MPRLILAGLFALLVGVTGSLAQGKADVHVREGDRFFQQMAYSRAVEHYELAAEMGAINEHVTKRLGECHMRMRNTEEAERWYGMLVKFLNVEPEDLYQYAEALKSNGQYEEAEKWMDQYLERVGRGNTRSNITGFVRKFTQNPERFTVRTTGINTAYAEFGATWLGSGRVAFVSSRNEPVGIERRAAHNAQPFMDIYVAEVTPDGDLFDAKPMGGNIRSRMHEGPLTASAAGDVIWFTRNQGTPGSFLRPSREVSRLGIYMARAVADKYEVVEDFPFNNASFSFAHPALSRDGRSLYFVSDMPGGYGGADIYVTRLEGGEWGEPVNLGPTINTERDELFPFLAVDGTLYFSSNGHPGLGGLDIHAALPSPKGGFAPPINVGAPVNGPKDDFAFIMDPAGKWGFFSSNRPGGQGDDDIYGFRMHAPLEQGFLCMGQVIDDEYEIPVIAAEVELRDEQGKLLASTVTDGRGEYSFPVEKDRTYKIVARMKGRYDGERYINTGNIEEEQIITRDIHLVADAGIWMRGVVGYKDQQGFIEGMTVSVVNLSSFHAESRTTDEGGAFSMRLQSNEEFEVLFEKTGFFSLSVPLSTVGMRQGIIDMNEARELRFERIEIGTPIPLKHLRWELGKANLDPIARTELDALAERLLVNPALLIEVAVHSDARGEADVELYLSRKRAEAIAAYLLAKGIPKERVSAKGYGNTRILNHCVAGVSCTEEEHAVNRRTTYTVVAIQP
jgi:hypothetical protein